MTQINKLSLAALRAQINAGTRDEVFITDDGSVTHMVYIPRFTVPKGLWDDGAFPAEDMNLGGFFIDKYACSHKKATAASRGCNTNITVQDGSTTDVAVSVAGKVPWTDIDWDNAKKACANRKINGAACHLVTMKEWATVAFLTKLLGHDIRGNNNSGKDYRDSTAHGNYGMPDAIASGRCLTGTGPLSWSHNGMANGVFDMCGNVWEWVDFFIEDGIYTHQKKALINDSDGITATDTTITLDNVEDASNWPASGTIQIENEQVNYNTIQVQDGAKAILSNCQRGRNGTTAATHANDVAVYQLTKYCITPGGATAWLTANIDAGTTTLTFENLINGEGNNGFAVNDTIQVEKELMTVTAVSGTTLTVTRGQLSTTAAAHVKGKAVNKMCPQMDIYDNTGDPAQNGRIELMRPGKELAVLALPKKIGTDKWDANFWMRKNGKRAAIRGGDWGHGADARSAFALSLDNAPSARWHSIGFRSALSL